MPTYEYACPDCGHKFESFHAMSAKPVKLCPECGKKKVKRLISAGGGLIFKGSGFYLTDYVHKNRPSESVSGDAPKEPTKKAEPESAKPQAKSEAKPAAKPAAAESSPKKT